MPDSKLYHLLEDFGVYKASLVRNFEDNDRGPEHNDVRDLLAKRTQRYTLLELEALFGFLTTAHQECVVANPEDYSPVEVYQATKRMEFADEVLDRFQSLKAELGLVSAE